VGASRFLCARFPHLALVIVWRRHPELRAEPVIVGGAPELRLPVLAASAAARASGVRPGQPLREAQQRCPGAAFVSAVESEVARLRAELLARLYRLAPAVEVGDEAAWCDLTGRHAAHPDGTGWAVSIARSIDELLDAGDVAVGVAASRLVAEIAARQAGTRRIRRVADGEEAAFLAPLPLSVLALDPAVAARLAALGLDCVGAVANLSAADLQRQFGPAGMDLWRQVRGGDGIEGWRPGGEVDSSIPARQLGERLVLEGGTGDLEALRFAVHRSALALGDRLRRRGCRAAAVTLVCELEDAEPSGLRITPLQPPGGGAELWPVALELLAGMHLTAPVTAVRLEVEGLEPGAGRQVDLWRDGDAAGEEIGGAAARLRARFGRTAVRRAELTVDPGDLPERRFRWAEPVAVEVDGDGRDRRAAGPAPGVERGTPAPGTPTPGTPAAAMPALRR
jgi:nucleotidyltransferase/DNA polymerase involved in DNA repair